jgi:GH15 family glucan-1,4-alpha-glucosidase
MKPMESDVRHASPGTNGDRAHLEAHGELEQEIAVPHPRIASAFPPIADYAFLSDCEVNALVAPSGRLEWMCLPRPDSPSVFAAMLDRAADSFRFGPSGVQVPAGRRYLPGTLVLETTWRTRTGWMIVRDALCIGPWYHSQRRSGTNRRPPTDYEGEHILLRTARCVVGDVELSLDCQPVFDYGRTSAKWEYAGPGYGEAIASGGETDVPIRLVTDLRMGSKDRARTRRRRCARARRPTSPWSGPGHATRPPRSQGEGSSVRGSY